MVRRNASLTLPVAAALLLAACGSGDPEPVAEAPAADASAATDSPAAADAATGAVPVALDFSAPLIGGGEIELGSLAGRPVLLWFWAPW